MHAPSLIAENIDDYMNDTRISQQDTNKYMMPRKQTKHTGGRDAVECTVGDLRFMEISRAHHVSEHDRNPVVERIGKFRSHSPA